MNSELKRRFGQKTAKTPNQQSTIQPMLFGICNPEPSCLGFAIRSTKRRFGQKRLKHLFALKGRNIPAPGIARWKRRRTGVLGKNRPKRLQSAI
ncbi:MAG: hypothetical protein MUD08_09880 [Cytophagales bacterium]|nr:hypothetical protein [Cytophagales bacterium]